MPRPAPAARADEMHFMLSPIPSTRAISTPPQFVRRGYPPVTPRGPRRSWRAPRTPRASPHRPAQPGRARRTTQRSTGPILTGCTRARQLASAAAFTASNAGHQMRALRLGDVIFERPADERQIAEKQPRHQAADVAPLPDGVAQRHRVAEQRSGRRGLHLQMRVQHARRTSSAGTGRRTTSGGVGARTRTNPPKSAGATLSGWAAPQPATSPCIAHSSSTSSGAGRPSSSLTATTAATALAPLLPTPLASGMPL